MENLLKGLTKGQLNFMETMNNRIKKTEDSCILNKKLMTMLESMKDSLNFKADLFESFFNFLLKNFILKFIQNIKFGQNSKISTN